MISETLVRKSSAKQPLDAASHSANGSDSAPRQKEHKLAEMRAALARAHAKQQSLMDRKKQLTENSVDQAIEYEQLRDALTKVKPHYNSDLALDRRYLDNIINLCVNITERTRTEDANLRDELAAKRTALVEAESARDSAIEERNRLAQAAESKAREVNHTVVSLQQEVEVLRLQCVEREHEYREQIEFVTREARCNINTADELCEATKHEMRENESAQKDLQTELEQVTSDMQARIDALEEDREEARMALAEKDRVVKLEKEEETVSMMARDVEMSVSQREVEAYEIGRHELEMRIDQLEREKAEGLKTLLEEVEQLRASNNSSNAQSPDTCSRCAELTSELVMATSEGDRTRQEVEFVRRLHVDAVTQATSIQAEMEATLLQLRQENADLRRQAARTRLDCIREEESPQS